MLIIKFPAFLSETSKLNVGIEQRPLLSKSTHIDIKNQIKFTKVLTNNDK